MNALASTCFTFWILIVTAAFAIDSSPKRPLDLPSGGRGSGGDEEDAPETISFYQSSYEGDGFFWCLDKSCSMGWAGELDTLKAETVGAIHGLSANSEFSLVAFSSGTSAFSSTPVPGSQANKVEAISWVQSLQSGGSTCLVQGGVEVIGISNLSDKDSKNILVLSDGVPGCDNGSGGPPETLATLTATNWQRTPIHTIFIGQDAAGVQFMQQLAAQNGGTFTQSQ